MVVKKSFIRGSYCGGECLLSFVHLFMLLAIVILAIINWPCSPRILTFGYLCGKTCNLNICCMLKRIIFTDEHRDDKKVHFFPLSGNVDVVHMKYSQTSLLKQIQYDIRNNLIM